MAKAKSTLIVASTTSTQNSGLFDILIPAYEKASPYKVNVEIIAVGTGKAIRFGKKRVLPTCSSCMILSVKKSL